MDTPKNTTEPAPRSRLWLWVLAAFSVQLAAWIAWFILASHHQVAEVPLVMPR